MSAWEEYKALDQQTKDREEEDMQRHIDRTEGLSYPETREARVAAAWARLDAWLHREMPGRPPQTHTQEHAHDRGA